MSLKVGQKPQIYATRPQGGAYFGTHGNYIQDRGLVKRLDAYDTLQVTDVKDRANAHKLLGATEYGHAFEPYYA